VSFDGFTIPAGTPVFLAIAAGHRLPTVFEDPAAFRPERFRVSRSHPAQALATFGGGHRTCLGSGFAIAELKTVVAHVRRHYHLTPLPDQEIRTIDTVVQWLPSGMRVQVVPIGLRAERSDLDWEADQCASF
jgi:cytochrome P450